MRITTFFSVLPMFLSVSGCGSEPFCDEIALGTPITKLQRLSFTAIGTIQQKTLQGDCQPFKSGELGVVAVQAGARAPSCTPRDAYFCHVKLDDA